MVAVREVGRVYCFQSPSATVDFRPTRFVTIDQQLEGKLLAIQAFASQTEVRAYLEPDLIEATARYWSRYGDGRYAEAFEVIREAAADGRPGRPDDRTVVPQGAAAGAPKPAGATHEHSEVPYAAP